MRSAVTISLVTQARGGPFVLWDDLQASIAQAAELGYDAVELFLPAADAVDRQQLHKWLDDAGLKVAAVGTGAGMVIHQLSLTHADEAHRQKAIEFVKGIINLGGEFAAPAIIGSMQGRWQPETGREATLARLANSLQQLAAEASQYQVPLIYEPLNRYETNLCNTMQQGVELIESHSLKNVVLLADLFHMNIEETNVAQGLTEGGKHIGHVHFVDSNRRPAGCGHTDFAPIIAALKQINYTGYLSAEAFPWPDPLTAARKTRETYLQLFGQ